MKKQALMNHPDSEPINDPGGLWALQLQLLAMSESYFGTRDKSFRVFHPQFCKNGPNIRIEYAPRGAYAQLSYSGRFNWPTVVYELAHETIHLLNPGVLGTANNLEEGVAVAFSIYAQQAYGVKVQTPSIPSYAFALSLVKKLPDNILGSGKKIRQKVGRLSDATADDLRDLYPGLEHSIAEKLDSKFNNQ